MSYLTVTTRDGALEDFTKSLLTKIIAEGYRYLLYTNMEHFAIITPLRDNAATGDNSYIIGIEDEQCEEMAIGVEGFSFYVFPKI